jgi:hypothetical protein
MSEDLSSAREEFLALILQLAWRGDMTPALDVMGTVLAHLHLVWDPSLSIPVDHCLTDHLPSSSSSDICLAIGLFEKLMC